ncbi:hypothetical protein [Arthrobacter sp. Marseille-P9274]|uniref:hypothetical protein n=1 Tax=Arthrobacter sp. Marseille-P9274 TaxID=2866572 RepID=UPI0021C6407F|nr:hypothetical protein [Arthrobacter sp. Marseille-P9274]
MPEGQKSALEIRVTGPADELLLSEEMSAGMSLVSEDIPLGRVSISAVQLCTVETELTSKDRTMRLIVDASHCTLAD